MFEIIELNEAKKIIKNVNVIIYGSIRDIEEHFIKSFSNIDLLCNLFNKIYIIIFENDSLDGTRSILKQWASHSQPNVIKHLILEEKLNVQYPLRAHRLAYCRNKILTHIFENNLDKEYQYAIHCDLDDRFWSIDYDSICNCFQYDLNSWDAMFPVNPNYTYYDFWALRCNKTWFNKNIFSCQIPNNENCKEYENHVSEFCFFLQNNKNNLIPVNSAFNGIGMYKLSSLKNGRYSADNECSKCNCQSVGCFEDNDHIGLHKSMIFNNCKLFINPKMILENSKNEYTNYYNFICNLKNIPNIQKNPLTFVLYKKCIDTNHMWINCSQKMGEYENIISNFTSNKVVSFCIDDNTFYSNKFINDNIIIYKENLLKNIHNFLINNIDNFISFIHIDFNNYHNTKLIFEKLYKKIINNCIIVINKFINYDEYLLNDLHVFYEFIQKYNIQFEYIGINGDFSLNPQNSLNNNTSVAIRIINNPNLSKTELTSDLFRYEDKYIYFHWEKYIQTNNDLLNVTTKEEAWQHWFFHGEKENRPYYSTNLQKIEDSEILNIFNWEKYIENYDDLKHIQSKKEAWDHWIEYGKKEGRKECFNSNNNHDINNNIDPNIDINFNWKLYIENYDDLKHIQSKKEAWDHWMEYGKEEGRKGYFNSDDNDINHDINHDINIDNNINYDINNNINYDINHDINHHINNDINHDYLNSDDDDINDDYFNFDDINNDYLNSDNIDDNFDWQLYISNYEDLKHLQTKKEAWNHWINYGKIEGRVITNKNLVDLSNFDWKYYIEKNSDLNFIKTKEEAIDHWSKYGKNENRLFKKKKIYKKFLNLNI